MADPVAQMDQGMSYGLMNAFRTGNMVFDVIICMLVPMIVKAVFTSDWPNKIQQYINDFFKGVNDEYIRSISYETKSGGGYYYGYNSDLDSMERNNLLQKAIRLYLSEKSKYTSHNGDVFLIPGKKITLEKDRWGDECRFSGSYQQLMSYRVTMLPAEGTWVEIVGEGVHFRQTGSQSEEADGGDSKTTVKVVTFDIKACGPDGEKIVTDWIHKVFEWYRELKAKEQDMSRYFLQAQTKKSDEKEFQYKKYQLSEHKTFDTLFFPEKPALLKIVDDFLQKRGKFSIPGFPHKLGLLLDGPPGTGKTSLIKAIAQYTKRHIVTVSLDRINTNQELMDMMFDNRFNVLGADEPMVSKMDEIVFVMEDVDAASSVVYAREGAKRLVAPPQEDDEEEEVTNDIEKTDAEPVVQVATRARTAPPPLSRSVTLPLAVPSKPGGRGASGVLREMTCWEAEDVRDEILSRSQVELPYRAQVEAFFKRAKVPTAPYIGKITSWCVDQGAISFLECLENMEPLCKHLKNLKPLEIARLRGLAATMLGKKIDSDDEDDDNDDEGDDDDKVAALKSAMWQKMIAMETAASASSGNADAAAGSGGDDVGAFGPWMGTDIKSSFFAVKDKLNLAGLLNVLDGVVDTPGRILVMTTNHPEKLDPALIRPGRINKRLHLGYCHAETVAQMAQHYLQSDKPMNEEDILKCAEICEHQEVTPAWVEQCCAEVDTYSDLIRRLKRSVST